MSFKVINAKSEEPCKY